MATLVFAAVGTLVGGPLGGAIGALVGQQVDQSLFGGSIQGPRLSDLTVSSSSYGAALPRHFGQMRVAGAIIWATDLVEHSSTSGGGKGGPSVTSYSYTSSFAVALASRPLLRVGRIWADGSLLRGAAGDLKVGGTMRFYPGDQTQNPDPLIAGAEGASTCPAFRGLSYVVFEGLDLTNFGNRIPSMTFEVFADTGPLSLAQLFDGLLDTVDGDVPLTGVTGFSCEGSFKDTLTKFQPVFPMSCDADGTSLTIAPERLQSAPIALSEPSVSEGQGDFGGKTGFTRKRAPPPLSPPRMLRYYDVELDYQPGIQRARGQPAAGQPKTIQLPASLTAANAFQLISQTATNINWARDTLDWRSSELDPAIVPGAIVTVAGEAGQWRVTTWEWHSSGVDLALERLAPAGASGAGTVDAGGIVSASDLVVTPTVLDAFELPWDGKSADGTIALFAAVSSAGSAWTGAALYVDQGDGNLQPLGSSGRQRSTMGVATTVLAAASPLVFDRQSRVIVQLAGSDMTLADATADQLIGGANRALLGSEIIQFGNATPLGSGAWQLGALLRGRGGTESQVGSHIVGEKFVLLDSVPVALNPSLVGPNPSALIAAIGVADSSAVESAIACQGITLKPLCPVRPATQTFADGSLTLSWTRRARGAWVWQEGVDVPLVEETEAYQVTYGDGDTPVAQWTVTQPSLMLPSADLSSLRALLTGGSFLVRQIGTYAQSDLLFLGNLA
jgi:hypothetical protein